MKMDDDLLAIRDIYLDLFKFEKDAGKDLKTIGINTVPLYQAMSQWQGEWSTRFAVFLGQIGVRK